MNIDNPETLRRHLRDKINFFVGAGFSVLARDHANRFLPTGRILAQELRAEFACDRQGRLDLPKLCTVIASTASDRLNEYIQQRFTVRSYDARYRVIERLDALQVIFTTNVDNLIHRIFETSTDRYINDLDFQGPIFRDRHAIDLVMLHGSVLHNRRLRRFGTIDLASAFGADPDRWRYLQTRLQQFPTIFWGYALEDAATLDALAPVATSQRADAWIVVNPDQEPTGLLDYFRALHLQIVLADTSEFLDFIAAQIPARETGRAPVPHDTRSRFPNEAVPLPAEVPAHPIVEFFKGASPAWSHIYAGVFRTSHFRELREKIYAGGHLLITGVPATGKTTLIMQLAAEIHINGHKLITSNLTRPKAEFMLRRLSGERALIFVDNCCDDTEPLNALVKAGNIQIVGADRDYNLNTVLHRIPWERFHIVDVTPLSNEDLEGCRQAIPEAIRTPTFERPETTPGVIPSLFEFVQANILEPTLRDRFENAMRELRQASPELAEMLLLVAHVHVCRTPISMDMVLAYWRDSGLNYTELYELISRVGGIITEYGGDLADEPQDYFCARSSIVAEAVLAAADGDSLRRMILQLRDNVSTYRICHYRIFQRRAYDSKLIGRAFADWKEGAQFYDSIYQRELNPYILQQKALFLSSRRQHSLAFSAIDGAIALAGSHNFTIRNSHAAILFRANISFAADPEARTTLDKSMLILKNCHDSDRRKAYHALAFADFAIQYWDAYRDSKAQEYLDQAELWLKEAHAHEPWLSGTERLLRLVQRRK